MASVATRLLRQRLVFVRGGQAVAALRNRPA
jgi:hypothetical protein